MVVLFLASTVLAGLAFMFSASILLQVLACALYNNWWPMLSGVLACYYFVLGELDLAALGLELDLLVGNLHDPLGDY
ncbi:hypothetical protein RHGRI_003263 [Rhododendron griersonianum]|uniref:NADH dehydrogenase subunit 6 n=1 Tax=Rhododendron griersonianum TaxID=479676 RepID=A0AAV6L598_9ERIC|nr:hypothetical protein RHGRI_003263 [Rhododendron griersonianum]